MAVGHARAPDICVFTYSSCMAFPPLPPFLFATYQPEPSDTHTPTRGSQQARRKSNSKRTLGKEQETNTEMAITGHLNFTCGFSLLQDDEMNVPCFP